MEELRAILLDLQLKLNSIVNRIPEGRVPEDTSVPTGRALSMSKSPIETRTSETELPGKGSNGCPEQYHSPVLVAYHKWARIILSLYIDKVRDPRLTRARRSVTKLSYRHFASRINLSSKMPAVVFGPRHVRGEKAHHPHQPKASLTL